MGPPPQVEAVGTTHLCLEGALLALFSSSSRRRRASSSCVRGLGAGLGGIVGS